MPPKRAAPEGALRKSKRSKVTEIADLTGEQRAEGASASKAGKSRVPAKGKGKKKSIGGLGIFEFMQELPLELLLEVCACSQDREPRHILIFINPSDIFLLISHRHHKFG